MDWLYDLLNAILDQLGRWVSGRVERWSKPSELPEDTYAKEQEALHIRDLCAFDTMLKAELGLDYLPWEQRPFVPGAWSQLLRPGLSQALGQQQFLPIQLQQMQQMQQRQLTDQEWAQQQAAQMMNLQAQQMDQIQITDQITSCIFRQLFGR